MISGGGLSFLPAQLDVADGAEPMRVTTTRNRAWLAWQWSLRYGLCRVTFPEEASRGRHATHLGEGGLRLDPLRVVSGGHQVAGAMVRVGHGEL
jgi:hypothetical protein